MKIICAVKDRAINAFGQPFFEHTRGSAIRAFRDAVNQADANNQFNKHPEDFDLYQIGEYDENTGVVNGTQTAEGPIMIARAQDLKE